MAQTKTLEEIYESLKQLKRDSGTQNGRLTSFRNRNGGKDMETVRLELISDSKSLQNDIDKINYNLERDRQHLEELDPNDKDDEASIKVTKEAIKNREAQLSEKMKAKKKIDDRITELQERQNDISKKSEDLAAARDDIIAQLVMHPAINLYMRVEIEKEYEDKIAEVKSEKDNEVGKYKKIEEKLSDDDTTKEIVTRLKEAYKSLKSVSEDFSNGVKTSQDLAEANDAYESISKDLTTQLKSLGVIDDCVDYRSEDDSRLVITKRDIEQIAQTDGEDYSKCLSGKESTEKSYLKRIRKFEEKKASLLNKIEKVKNEQIKGQSDVQKIDDELVQISEFLSGYDAKKKAIESEYQDACDNLDGKNGKPKIDELIYAKQREIDEKKNKNGNKSEKEKKLEECKNDEIGKEKLLLNKSDEFINDIKKKTNIGEYISKILKIPGFKEKYNSYKKENMIFRQLILNFYNEPSDDIINEIKTAIKRVRNVGDVLCSDTGIPIEIWNMYVVHENVAGKNDEELEDVDDCFFDNSAKIQTEFALKKYNVADSDNTIKSSVNNILKLQGEVLSNSDYIYDEVDVEECFSNYSNSVFSRINNDRKRNNFFATMGLKLKSLFRKKGLFSEENESLAKERIVVDDFKKIKDKSIEEVNEINDIVLKRFSNSFYSKEQDAEIKRLQKEFGEAMARTRVARKEYDDIEDFIVEDTSELEAQLQVLVNKKGEYEEKRNNKDKKISDLDTKKTEAEKRRQELLSQKQKLSPHSTDEVSDGYYLIHKDYRKINDYITGEFKEWLDPQKPKDKKQEDPER